MFDFLKKQEADEPKNNPSNYPKEVLEIHHEFDIAADKLLAEASVIIKEAERADVKKVSRLESLGFRQAQQVTEIRPLINQALISEAQVKLVEYYKREYPLQKFITEQQVKAICHKWNLVCGDVGRYKGFVPEKNLRQIEGFKLKEKDKQEFEFTIVTGSQSTPSEMEISADDLTDYGKKYINSRMTISSFYITDDRGTDSYSKSLGVVTEECAKRFLPQTYVKVTFQKIGTTSYKICAPVKDMDISGLTLVDGYKLIKHVPDPVVLQPVKRGYLILTAWGDEASDENVVNETMN
jgi:hypothetical protein